MATVTTSSPATLQPCKHETHAVVRHCGPPLPWRRMRRRRSYGQVTTASFRGQPPSAAGGGRVVEVPPVGVGAEEDAGDSIRRLQNGPDVRGVALEGEHDRPVYLTPLAVVLIAESFGEWLHEELRRRPEEELRVSVGRDPRLSGARLSAAVFAGLASAGCAVFDVGLASTPACFMSS